MEFHIAGKSRVGFRHIHPVQAEFIRSLPFIIEPDALSEAAEQRFYPAPADAEDLGELRADWKAFVEPGLQELFRSTRDIVATDLKNLIQNEDTFEIVIPLKHADAWVNVLVQARLAIAAAFDFDEDVLNSKQLPDLSNERGLAIIRLDLYADMEECLIEQLE